MSERRRVRDIGRECVSETDRDRQREEIKLNVPSLCAGGTSTREHLLQIHWEREGTKEREGEIKRKKFIVNNQMVLRTYNRMKYNMIYHDEIQ